MDQLLLSNEQYEALKAFRDGIRITPEPELTEYLINKGLLTSKVTDYQYIPRNESVLGGYLPASSVFVLTEFGKGYLYAYEQRQKEIDSISSMAESAKKEASFADLKSWIAIAISGIALIFEYAVNHVPINKFFNGLIK